MTGGIRTLEMMPSHDFFAPLKKTTNWKPTAEEPSEDSRNVSPVIRPKVGPWTPGAILNQGAQSNSFSDQEKPTIWLPERHLSLAVEALGGGGGRGRKRSNEFLNDMTNGHSVNAGKSFEGNAEKSQDILSLDWAGTDNVYSSSSKNRCVEDVKNSPFYLWLPPTLPSKNSGNSGNVGSRNCFEDRSESVPNTPVKKEQTKEQNCENKEYYMEKEWKKEQKKEYYMEMKATGLATFQHLDFLMKHLELLIERAEERLGESSTVHAAHSRLVQERHNAEAVDSCAKAAIEQLETLRKGLSFVLPSLNSHQQLTATKHENPAVKVEKETSLTLDCGGSYERLSPGSSGDSGGESTREDDVVEIKNHENSEPMESKAAYWAQSIGQSLISNIVSPLDRRPSMFPSPSPSLSPSPSPSRTQLPENRNESPSERHSHGNQIFPQGTTNGRSTCYNSLFSPDLKVSTPYSGISSLPTGGICSLEKPTLTFSAPSNTFLEKRLSHFSPPSQSPLSSEVLLPSLSLKAETTSTVSMEEEEEEEEAEERKESALVVTWKHQGNGQDSQSGTASKRQRTRQQEEEVPGDTWHWRKYGQKVIKDTQLYRSYYRCGCRKGTTCAAKRHVDRYVEGNTVKSVVYEGEHCHPKPPPKTRTTILIRNSPKTS